MSDGAPLTDRSWYPFFEKMVELDVPALIHSAGTRNPFDTRLNAGGSSGSRRQAVTTTSGTASAANTATMATSAMTQTGMAPWRVRSARTCRSRPSAAITR